MPGALRQLGWDFWALLLVATIAVGWGLQSLMQPREPNRLPAILGYRDPPRPTPTTLAEP